MKLKKMQFSKFALVCASAFLLFACDKKEQFVIEGKIDAGKDKVVYLENIGTSNVVLLDSVKLGADGSFKFKQDRPEAPDFYRLRLDKEFINVAIDSTETVVIHADTLRFARNYTVEGSADCEKIKNLTFLQLSTSEAYNKLQKEYDNKTITPDQYMEQVGKVIENYKDAARSCIYANPKSSAAYFAFFQQINSLLIFDPYDKTDYKALGALATSWQQYYPDAPRTTHLCTLALNALKTIRGEKPLEYKEANEKDVFNFSLPDIKEKNVDFLNSVKGKSVLLDFTSYQMEQSLAHNLRLAAVYEKYKSQGLEIFQVSLDADDHFWKNAAVNLPWICVRDPKSIYSTIASTYNVKELPTGFLFNKNGEIIKRLDSDANLDKEIQALLK